MTRLRPILGLLAAVLITAACKDDRSASAPQTPATPAREPAPVASPTSPAGTLPSTSAGEPVPSTPAKPTAVRPTTSPATQPEVVSMQTPSGDGVQTAPTSRMAEFAGLTAPKPATWLWQPPPNSMYVADYVVPGRDGHDQARISVFKAGGSIQMNIDRWKAQFRSADRQPVEPKISEMEVSGMDVTLVEFAGEYMGMGSPSFTADRLFITAIVQSPSGQLFIRFVGPTATVEANRQAFMEMVQGLREAEPAK